MRKLLVSMICAILIASVSHVAMAATDKYADAQTDLSYTVYKPSRTLGLPTNKFQLIPCTTSAELWIYAKYGGSARYLEIMQTAAGVKCSDPGLSKQLKNVTINGVSAKVFVYCDPTKVASAAKCNTQDITRVGGYLLFTNKAGKNLKRTEIQVQAIGGITYAQLLTVAKSLKVVKASGNAIQPQSNSSFTVGEERPTTVTMPTKYSQAVPAPLLIDLHGYSSSALSHGKFAQMGLAAQKSGAIYVAPNGLADALGNQFWNASKACCNFNKNLTDDAAFIKSLIDEISAKASVDPQRIYIFGHSNGHFMAYNFACTYPGTVAAIAGLAGAMDVDSQSCAPKSPVNILHIHGTEDEVIRYNGGALFGNSYTSALDTTERWAQLNKCSANSVGKKAIDLVTTLKGAETSAAEYSCPKATVELWSINRGNHGPKSFDPSFGSKVMDWLLAHPKK